MNYIYQTIDDILFKMRSFYDFGFINKYGKVFKVFDSQNSGNICFGTVKDDAKYFIKFAGLQTAEYNGDTKVAVNQLKKALPIYKKLKHKNLIDLVDCKNINNGFAMIFKWIDGYCMGRVCQKEHKIFMQLPTHENLIYFSIYSIF